MFALSDSVGWGHGREACTLTALPSAAEPFLNSWKSGSYYDRQGILWLFVRLECRREERPTLPGSAQFKDVPVQGHPSQVH